MIYFSYPASLSQGEPQHWSILYISHKEVRHSEGKHKLTHWVDKGWNWLENAHAGISLKQLKFSLCLNKSGLNASSCVLSLHFHEAGGAPKRQTQKAVKINRAEPDISWLLISNMGQAPNNLGPHSSHNATLSVIISSLLSPSKLTHFSKPQSLVYNVKM